MSFQVKIRRKCERCNGSGFAPHPQGHDTECPDCNGTGWVEAWADAKRSYYLCGPEYCTVQVKL